MAILSDKQEYNTDDKFIAVTAKAYMPIVISELETILIKSWIPRESWEPEAESKLTTLCDYLEKTGGHCQIEESVFNKNLYFDPNDRSKFMFINDKKFVDSLELK